MAVWRLGARLTVSHPMRLTLHSLIPLWRETILAWRRDNASRLSAALAFYALLSMTPLLVVTVLVMGLFFGAEGGKTRTIDAIASVVGPQGSAALETMAASAHHHGDNLIGSLIAVAIALFGASGVFVELQDSLNLIWEVPEKQDGALVNYAVKRFWSFVMVVGAALLLLLSVISSTVLSIVVEFFEHILPGGELVWQWLNFGVSLSILTLLFGLIYRVVPDTAITWADVWLGSFMTALLFVVGNVLLSVYLGRSGVTSSFGGAGSVVALVIWVYYSAQIVFLGAEFTHVYAHRHGSLSHEAPGSG